MKQDCDVSFPTHLASSAPAPVTNLVFLQVPAYPEVFRDGLHTFKLNEQDTDVRAALPAPSDHDLLMLLFSSLFSPMGLFLHPPLSLLVAFHASDSCLSSGPQTTAFHLLLPPSPSLLGFDTSSLPLSLCPSIPRVGPSTSV